MVSMLRGITHKVNPSRGGSRLKSDCIIKMNPGNAIFSNLGIELCHKKLFLIRSYFRQKQAITNTFRQLVCSLVNGPKENKLIYIMYVLLIYSLAI